MNELWLFLILFIALLAIKTTMETDANDPGEDAEVEGFGSDSEVEEFKHQRLAFDHKMSEKWARSGTTQETIYDYDNLPPDNRTCDYRLGASGPDYISESRPGDRSDYYRAPIHPNEHLDHETLLARAREAKRQVATELFSLKTTELMDYRLPGERTLSEFLRDKSLVDKYDHLYETNPTSDPSSENQNKITASPGHDFFWRKNIGQDADPDFKACVKTDASPTDNYKVVRPDRDMGEGDHAKTRDSLTEDLPCTEPSLPWVQDPHLQDDLNRPYCQKQDVPCATCGTFRGAPNKRLGGPNRVPIVQMSDAAKAVEDSEDLAVSN